MDKYEKRRAALKGLVDSLGRGGIATIAARIGKEPNYVSRMLYPPGKKGRKRIGEDSADALAAAYPEWFGDIPRDMTYEKAEPPPPKQVMEPQEPWTAYSNADPETKAVVDAILGVGERPPWFDSSAVGFIDVLKSAAKKWIDKRKNGNAAAA